MQYNLHDKDSDDHMIQHMQEEYEKFTDAEIFAIAYQCGLDLERELHLLNYLVMITAQVKAKNQVQYEFRYLKDSGDGQRASRAS